MSAIAALLVMGVVTLVSPWAFGWPAADERQAVLATALHDPRGGHHAIKLVPVNDLPASLNWVSRRQASGNVWVVATSGHLPGEDGELGAPPATWTVQVFLEGAETNVGGTGGTTGLWPPFFDQLPDRSPPSWWPNLVPSPEVAAPILLLLGSMIALGLLVAMVRAVGVAVSHGVRRLGRPT